MKKPKDDRHRWSKFTWESWRADPALRICSMGARAMWMELLCLAHDGRPYGHVTVNGQSPSIETLVVLCGGLPAPSQQEVAGWIAELEAKGVLSRDEKGVIFSRRMVRDFEAFKAAKKSGQSGGNPVLVSKKSARNQNDEDKATLKPPVKPPLKATLILESESESESEYIPPQGAAGRKTAPRGKRGARLPDEWQPSDADRDYAENLGLDARRVAEDFRGYWLAKAGKDATKVDWSLTWQGWCRRQADRKPTAKQDRSGFF